ncbi:MAG TPA: FKBP-type peptidyl-prolyl cis-trans isomerase [Pirellulales bacterium]|nr:FKBP-type peptidyl-prolyl cis-trans isomerase [Pirellulales bacterium]
MAYQEEGMADPRSGQQVIPPNATLVFEVELLGVEKGSKGPSLK